MSATALNITYEEAVAELWSRGELSWKLRPEQVRLKAELEKPAVQLAVFNVSRRFGKTFTLVLYCIEQALRSNQRIRYGAAFLSELEEFIIPAFEFILYDCPSHLKPTYVKSKKTFTFPNGSQIKFVGLDKNPNGLRGNALNIIIIDEAAFVANLKKIHTSVIIPATMKQTNIKVVFISTPPESPSHYFASELIYKAQTKANGYYICLTIDDISDLDPEERLRVLEEVGGADSITARREFFCEIIVDEQRAVLPEFTRDVEKATVKAVERPQFFDHYVALDVGFKDATAALFGYYDFPNAAIVIEDEYLVNKATTDVIANGLITKEKNLYGEKVPLKRVSDHDLRLIEDLRVHHKLYFSQTEKKEKEKAINQLRMLLKSKRIIIHPRCVHLIAQLRAVVWNKTFTSFDRDAANSHFDLIDALIYFTRAVQQNRNPTPHNHGLSKENHHINQQDRETKSALKTAFQPF